MTAQRVRRPGELVAVNGSDPSPAVKLGDKRAAPCAVLRPPASSARFWCTLTAREHRLAGSPLASSPLGVRATLAARDLNITRYPPLAARWLPHPPRCDALTTVNFL